jgi:predicted phosphodiesterase
MAVNPSNHLDPDRPSADDAPLWPALRELAVLSGRALWRGTRFAAPHLVHLIGVLIVALAGIAAGLLAAGPTHGDVGPFRAEFTISPTTHGGSELDLPPLGSVHLRTHDGPAHLTVNLKSLDPVRTEALVAKPDQLEAASQTAADDIELGVIRTALRTTGAALLGALVAAALVYRRMRRVAQAGLMALAVMVASLGIAFVSFRPTAIEEPQYQGLLANAPAVIGNARRIADDFAQYRAELQRLVANASQLYGAYSQLPIGPPDDNTIRVLHISDMHLNPAAWSVVHSTVDIFHIDVVVDTGDIVDWGTTAEAAYVNEIGKLKVPYVYVRGNHDSASTAAAVAAQPNAHVLEDKVETVGELTFAGIGDPRFTPDKSSDTTNPQGQSAIDAMVLAAGGRLAQTIRANRPPTDIALVHDPVAAPALAGLCPIVLAGHTHQREVSDLPVPQGDPPTLLMVEGSTGGAGLRGLEQDEPHPLQLSVLYFAQDKTLQGYDDITIGGTGQTQVTLQRHVIAPPADESGTAIPSAPSPAGGR